MLAISSHNFFLLLSSLLTVAIAIFVRFRLARRPKLNDNTVIRIIKNRIWLDDYRMPRGEFFWSAEQAEFIFQRLALESTDSQSRRDYLAGNFQNSEAMSFVLGFSAESLVRRSLVADSPHALLIGSTGSGKTQLMKQLLSQLVACDEQPLLVCIDFKGGVGLRQFENQSIEFASDHDLQNAERVILAIESELSERELGRNETRHLIIAIDELAHLLAKVKRAADVLAAVAARGRSAHMYLIMTNQNTVGLGRQMLSNTGIRVLIGSADPVDAAILGQPQRISPRVDAGFAVAQVLSHGQPAEGFTFALSETRELKQAREPSSHAPQQHQRSATDPRVYSGRGRARHRLRKQPAIRGLLSRARMAASR